VRDYRSALQSNSMQYATFFRGMLTRGIYPPPSQFEAWFLSAAHTSGDVEKTVKAAKDVMKNL
jgi:glutamate-1-semialdehyde 2,1-aminomutase